MSCVGYLLVDEAGDYIFVTAASEIERCAAAAHLAGGYRVIEIEVLASKPETQRVDAVAPAGKARVTLVACNGAPSP